MTAAPRFGFVVTYVDDLTAAKRFYVETLGLRVEREAPTFVQFEHFALATDESMDGRRNPELYWLVADAEAASAELGPKAPLCMPLRTLPFGRVFGVRDPAGQPRYLLQLATARPSRPLGDASRSLESGGSSLPTSPESGDRPPNRWPGQ